MADTSPLLASLLLGQRHRVDPIEAQRAFGQKLIVQGSSTAPLGSGNWLEGLARALQGGLGGLQVGLANAAEEAKGQQTVDALGQIAGAKNRDELTAAIKSSKIDPEYAGPLMAQILQNKYAGFGAQEASKAFGSAFGGTSATPPAQGNGLGITITPGQRSAAPGAIPPEWDQHIQGAAAVTGLPPALIKSVALTESGGNANAVSPAGAGGPMQLMPGTARDLGVPNPFDPKLAIPGGASYLRQQLDKFGNLDHALAAYNWGPGNTAKWIAAGADPAQLPQETQAYIAKVKAGAGIGGQPQVPQQGQPIPSQGGEPTPGAMGGQPPAQGPQGGPQVAQAGPPQPGSIPQQPQVAQTPMPSATSEPPRIPFPNATQQQIAKYQTLMSNPDRPMSMEQAVAGLQKELYEQHQTEQHRADEIWRDQQQSKRIQEQGQQRIQQEAPMTMIKDRVSNYETKIRPGAQASVDNIYAIHQARQVLDAGAFVGTGAEAKTALAKLGEQLGFPSDQAVNTQVLGSVLAKRTLAAAGGSLGQGFSNADRDFMDKAALGNISADEPAMRRVLDLSERQSRQTIKNHDIEAARVQKLPGVAALGAEQFQLPEAPTYEQFNKANPLAPLQTGPAAGQPQAPQAGQSRQLPSVSTPEEGDRLPRGTRFRLPDGRIGTVP